MAIPAVLILAAFFWIIMSLVKYWYYSKFQIQYKHKIDDKLLKEIRRPPKHIREKIAEMHKAREKHFDDDPIGFYKREREKNKKRENGAGDNGDGVDLNSDKFSKESGRPMNIFEEIDMRKKNNSGYKKYDRSNRDLFEDPLSRLYRELQAERKEMEKLKKKKTSTYESKQGKAENDKLS